MNAESSFVGLQKEIPLKIHKKTILEWGWNAHANTKSGSRSLRGPVIGLDGRRIVTSRRVADLVERSGATCLEKMPFLE